MKRIAVLLLAVSLLFACAKKEEKKGAYLARIGNTTITQADFEREMKGLPGFAQQLFKGDGGNEKFLEELIKKEILYQEALKKNLDKNPEFRAKVEDFKKITLVSILLEKEIEAHSKVTDQEVKEFYEKNRADFAPVNQIKASHILVKTEGEAKKIIAGLKKGDDFAQIAKKSSIDPGSKQKGGDLGYISKGQMVREFEAAALRLKPGEISEPVKTQFGYHVIKVTELKTGKIVEFDQVKNMLSQRLSAKKQKEFFDTYMEGLKKNYKVDVNKDAFSKMTPKEESKEKTPEKPETKAEPIEAPQQKK
jgi:peptidyl-prolyl cis-trans isomerase C